MNNLAFMKSPPLYFEFGRDTLRVFNGSDGAEFPLERAADGRLTAPCRARLPGALKQFLKAHGWPAHVGGWCAIDARGVSLRCLLLPVVNGDGLYQVVRLQIEGEFPLTPDELAWGYRVLGQPQRQPDNSVKQTVLVAAVRKEIVADYAEVLTAAGIKAEFTISALVRAGLCPLPPANYAVLELGAGQSELAGFEGEAAAFVRVLPPAAAGEAGMDALARAVGATCRSPKLYIFGDVEAAAQLARRLSIGLACEHVKLAAGPGISPAILGLQLCAEERGGLPLSLSAQPAAGPKKSVQPVLIEWGVRAAILLAAVLLFPYLEAGLLTGSLSAKVDSFKGQSTALESAVDHELGFLQYLKQNQPPFLESFYLIAKAAPQGIHIDSLSMNRRGDVALRGSMRNGDQVADFRSKLIGSGFFASVTVEEQTPTQDHQKVNVRMTAEWNPMAKLQALKIGPDPDSLNKTNAPDSGGPGAGPVPPGGMPGLPPGLPPGVVVPAGANIQIMTSPGGGN